MVLEEGDGPMLERNWRHARTHGDIFPPRQIRGIGQGPKVSLARARGARAAAHVGAGAMRIPCLGNSGLGGGLYAPVDLTAGFLSLVCITESPSGADVEAG